VIAAQTAALAASIATIEGEGFDRVYRLRGSDAVERARVARV
jgi:hypothetical protein